MCDVVAIMFADLAICTHYEYVGHNYVSNNCNTMYHRFYLAWRGVFSHDSGGGA